MSAEMFSVCGAALVCAVSACLLKRMKSEISFAVSLAGTLLFFGFVLASLESVMSEMSEILSLGGVSEYLLPITKALGVAIVAQIASGVCADCGESGIAQGVELAGKFEILLISLPLIKSIVGYAIDLISLE